MDRPPVDRRTLLEGYVAASRKLQRRLIVLFPLGLLLAFAVRLLWSGWAWLAVVSTLAFYGMGRYITATHIADWKMQLADLSRGAATPIGGRERDG